MPKHAPTPPVNTSATPGETGQGFLQEFPLTRATGAAREISPGETVLVTGNHSRQPAHEQANTTWHRSVSAGPIFRISC